ncbi:hypothetical protein V5O48_011555 [Marasmius crinis-equi]|uniref:Uncharacterized protein n=1 Tax=Marasmius crinis-equi TaxID=585013 RepID=A0ABR3F580_9AGAR
MLDTNSPPQHFQNAASKMKAVVEGVDGNGTIASHLLASARNMEDRLAYFAHHVQMERDEKDALQQKVNMWHSRVLQADALARENKCLKANAREAQRDIARLQTENNKLGRVVNGLKAEGERICGVEKVVEEKDRIIEELRGQIEEAKKENRLMKRKLKALSSSKPSRKRAVADPNDSLLVDYSNTVS